jgi:DNA mismatch repair ATPase MutL
MNIIKKGLSFLARKLQKYIDTDEKELNNLNNNNINNNSNNSNYHNNTNNTNNNSNNNENNNNNNNNNSNNSNYRNNYNKNNNIDNNYNNTNNTNDPQINKNQNQSLEQKHIFKKEINLNNKKNKEKIYTVEQIHNKIKTIWDVLNIKENTQAEHLLSVIPSDEWINMDDIKKRINLEFNIEYKNSKSLYPYLKTLTDINLIKVNNTGRKRSWKKNIIILE